MESNDTRFASMRALTGQKVGTCRLERLIGQGGMGAVYLAHQERLERRVAVKILRVQAATDPETVRKFQLRFQREANLIARLDHVNIIPIYEYGEQEGLCYLVMPYLTGGSLRDLLQKRGTIAPDQALIYLEQAARALDYAHEQGIIHRDLKPANFLLHADGRLVLADFGIARILASDAQDNAGATLTSTGILLGTPEYMAPEMVRGETLDGRADIYELGIVLYQMLSGSVPFKGNTPLFVAAMHLQQPLPSLHASNPALPAAIDSILATATAKSPAERFQTAGALAQAFRLAVSSPGHFPTIPSMNAPTLPGQSHHPPALLAGRETPASGLAPASDALLATPSLHSTPSADQPVTAPPGGTAGRITHQPAPAPVRQASKSFWFPLLAGGMITLLLVGGILVGLQLGHGNFGTTANQPGTARMTPTIGGATPAATATTPTPSPTPTPVQGVAKGTILYTTDAPGAANANVPCDGGNEQWANYNAPAITCQAGNVVIHNSRQALAGVILVALPYHASYPSNYVVEAQMQADTASQADFGLYFRNQPGNQQGIYTFLIHPDGSWGAYVYDNATGAPTQIGHGSAGVYAHARLTLDVVVDGSAYTFYVNSQRVGQTSDPTYPDGTAGIVVDAGGTIAVSAFTLYRLP